MLHQPFQGGRAVSRNRDLPLGMGKELRKLLADQLAVIHHEDASFHGALIRVEVGVSSWLDLQFPAVWRTAFLKS